MLVYIDKLYEFLNYSDTERHASTKYFKSTILNPNKKIIFFKKKDKKLCFNGL